MAVYYSHNVQETLQLAEKLAATLIGGEVIAMRGDLGAGKTAFVKGLARALGYDGEVSSPTFAIVHEYIGGRLDLYHFDMYRITGWEDLYSTGFFEYGTDRSVLAVEWSENIEAALPERYISVDIRRADGENDRVVEISMQGGAQLEDIGD